VQARVFSEFPSGETSSSLLALRAIEVASTRLPPEPTNHLVAGIDVAGSDDGDETVLVIRYGPTIVHLRRWTVADVRGEVALDLSQFKDHLESVNVDSVGIGHYFCLHLEDLGFPVVRVNVGSAPFHDAENLYLNRRAEIYFGMLGQRFKDGEIFSAVPWTDEIIGQLSSLR